MKLNRKAEYAILAIFDLALQPEGVWVKSSCISARQRIPKKFLELILGTLKQADLIETHRGPEGGCRLSKPASKITVGDVLIAIGHQNNEKGPTHEVFGDLWTRVETSVSAIIDQTSFANLAEQWRRKQTRYVTTWDI